MQYAGGIIGMPFSLEGVAFFTEAIFLGIYLYGWDRIPAMLHWLAGIVVAASGMLSAGFVVMVNAWMNAPTGFEVIDGALTNVDPIAVMLNPASSGQIIHVVLAAYVATGFVVTGARGALTRPPSPSDNACSTVPLPIVAGISWCPLSRSSVPL